MSWDYRVVRHIDKDDVSYAIHEAYYDDEANPDKATSITQCAIDPTGATLEELQEELAHIRLALDKPVLNFKDF
jgi:hypothetical protein